MAEVKLKNISKTYEGGNVAVSNVNLNIADKEFVVLVGPSGCGKSTTLRMIAGLEEITSGELYIDGKLMNNIPPAERDIAMVFQNYALYPHMTVYENMAFGLKLRKFPKEEIKERVNYAADILGIGALLDRKPKALSGGQRQRVAVGRAIVRKPKVFLFDEPLSNLDAKLRVQMRTEISKLRNRLETTMVYVTHDQTEAMTMGDRIVIMKDGLIHQVDIPMNLYINPVNRFVAGFIGSPSMNFLECEYDSAKNTVDAVNNNLFRLSEEAAKNLKDYSGKKILLGIRPENIVLEPASGKDSKINSAIVEVIEPLGNESLVYFKIGSADFVARVQHDISLEVGSLVSIRFNTNKINLFDPVNDFRIPLINS